MPNYEISKGNMRFAELRYAKKLSELPKFVNDKSLNYDLPKSSSYFDVSHISYKKTLNHNLPNNVKTMLKQR